MIKDILTPEFLSTVAGRQLVLGSLLTLLVGVGGVLVQQLVNGIKASRPLRKGRPLQLAIVLSMLFIFATMAAFQFPLTIQTVGIWILASGSSTILATLLHHNNKVAYEKVARRKTERAATSETVADPAPGAHALAPHGTTQRLTGAGDEMGRSMS